MSKGGKKDGGGYGKPPVDTRFKPGQSGNLRGRPRRSMFDDDTDEVFIEELHKHISVMVNGRAKKVHPLTLIARRLVKACVEGNLKAILLYKQFTDLQVLSQAAKARQKARNMKLLQDFLKDCEE